MKPAEAIYVLQRQIDAAHDLLKGRVVVSAKYEAWKNTTTEFLVQAFGEPSGNVERFMYIGVGPMVINTNTPDSYFDQLRAEHLEERIEFLKSCVEQLQTKVELAARNHAAETGGVGMQQVVSVLADPKKVFVVHGRNDAARKAMFDFLRALGLAPMEWNEVIDHSGKGTPYVGEAIDAAFKQAKAVVVILTGDDEARLRRQFCEDGEEEREKALTRQARPNVIFEAGLAFGRHPENTILVQIGTMRSISDMAGLHLVRYMGKDGGEADFRNALATRLERAGCEVNKKGGDWLSAGGFKAALEMHNQKDRYEE